MIISFQVHFNFICDDYCEKVVDGTNIIPIENYKSSTCVQREFDAEISLDNPIEIIIENRDGGYGIMFGTIDFHYFKLSISSTYQNLWTIGKEDETCFSANKVFGASNLDIQPHGGHNYQKCTCTLTLNICKATKQTNLTFAKQNNKQT